MDIETIVKIARGDAPADFCIINARMINVFSGDVERRDIAVARGKVVGFGAYEAHETVDADGAFVAPGFIDPHVHIESAMVSVTEFARAVLPFGTTTVVADPHEIANVMGREGIAYMLASAEDQPMHVYYTLPSCVPATAMESSGAKLDADDLEVFLDNPRIVALAEMMNFPGVINGDPAVLAKVEIARNHKKPVDGHAPGLARKGLHAYLSAGISSDHECTTVAEAEEKLRAGMHIMIREGTCARNLQPLLPLVTPQTARRLMWCTDDRHPHDLIETGHIDAIVREAIQSGVDPMLAIQMATLNPAEYFGLRELGAIAPGRFADLIFFSDLFNPVVEKVFCRGHLVAENAKMCPTVQRPASISIPSTMNRGAADMDLDVPVQTETIRVIDVVPDQVITRQSMATTPASKGYAVSDPDRDLLKIAVFERHHQTGNTGIAFVRGFGLKSGALGSSVAHDSHNIIVVGCHDRDMKRACAEVVNMKGGLVVVNDDHVLEKLTLPIGGLMSPKPLQVVRDGLDRIIEAAHGLGVGLADPFMTLSFLALPVIPELKITDLGLVDVNRFELVPLFVSA